MKRQSLRALRGRAGGGGGGCTQTRTRYNESSSFSNNLMKRESFRASRGMGENEFRQGLRVIIYETSKLPRFARMGGGGTEFRQVHDTTNRLLSLII